MTEGTAEAIPEINRPTTAPPVAGTTPTIMQEIQYAAAEAM